MTCFEPIVPRTLGICDAARPAGMATCSSICCPSTTARSIDAWNEVRTGEMMYGLEETDDAAVDEERIDDALD